jgi:hypothetical protein
MTTEEMALLILGFCAVLTIGMWIWTFVAGPDRDLEPNLDAPRLAKCGTPGCRNPHPYREWQERQR